MRRLYRLFPLVAALLLLLPTVAAAAGPTDGSLDDPTSADVQASPALETPADAAYDYDIPNGHFFTQTNGLPLGVSATGFSITNADGIPFWDAFQKFGGQYVVGYPVTRRFVYDGFVTQAMQKMVFQWRPDTKEVWFLNTFDALHDKGKDDWLLNFRQTPKPFDTAPDTGLTWDQVQKRHLSFLDQNDAIKKVYNSDPQPIDHYGLPVAYADMGNSFVIRAQRATFQYWKENVPWAEKGSVTVANGGDLAKESALWPDAAVVPEQPGTQPIAFPAPTSTPSAATPTPTPTPTTPPATGPLPQAGTGIYRARSPEYGMNIFLWGHPDTTQRDLDKLLSAGFSWQKTLFQWRQIEGAGKGIFDWSEADRVVRASTAVGVKIIARLDFQPSWARADGASNGPPDNPQDFTDFVYALVSRYKTGSPYGHIDAVEIWNEPNLAREWGNQKPDADGYVRLLKAGYEGAKGADPSVIVITAGLTPTETYNDDAFPDDVYLQEMYNAGAKNYFDVLGVHAAGYKAPPEMSPDDIAKNKDYGGQRFFGFRRVEDLRAIMVKNGDERKQVAVLEMGWTTDNRPGSPYAWHAVSEKDKGDYIVRAYQFAQKNWSDWIGLMSTIYISDPHWTPNDEQYYWAITNPDGTPRESYNLIKGKLPQ